MRLNKQLQFAYHSACTTIYCANDLEGIREKVRAGLKEIANGIRVVQWLLPVGYFFLLKLKE
jgi:hypothetical protein